MVLQNTNPGKFPVFAIAIAFVLSLFAACKSGDLSINDLLDQKKSNGNDPALLAFLLATQNTYTGKETTTQTNIADGGTVKDSSGRYTLTIPAGA